MDIINLPNNVQLQIANNMVLHDKIRLAYTCKTFFNLVIEQIYSKIVFIPFLPNAISVANTSTRSFLNNYDPTVSLIHPHNIYKFFENLQSPSFLGFLYSNLIVELYLESLNDPDVFNLPGWRNQPELPIFNNLKIFQFPTNLLVYPLNFEISPNLESIILDSNFSKYVDFNKGSVQIVNFEKISNLFIKGQLGANEDMLIFKLLTGHPHMIKKLSQLHFLVDIGESFDTVYRRVVGFFAILRKMNMILNNVHSLTFPLTNHSSSVIVSLVGKHVIFENLTSLNLLISDDSQVLHLVNSFHQLTTLVRLHGINIKSLSIKYHLENEDVEKNHLRSMMLLKFCESFRGLTKLNLDLDITGLNLSNLLMILGSPIANNLSTLKDIRVNVIQPSENLIGNILPTLEDAELLFPHLNFLHNCGCTVCEDILNRIKGDSNLFDETVKVSTLLIIGQELDIIQSKCGYKNDNASYIDRHSRFIRKNTYSPDGYLFDHLIGGQLNHSLSNLGNLEIFEICGLVYVKTVSNKFELLYGNEFKGLDNNSLTSIIDMGHVFTGNFQQLG